MSNMERFKTKRKAVKPRKSVCGIEKEKLKVREDILIRDRK